MVGVLRRLKNIKIIVFTISICSVYIKLKLTLGLIY
tara:strand:+ start:566 stop:673 length:108 start_codon:yes stop_codon:yes gene_type:complete